MTSPARLLPNGLGSRGNEEKDPPEYPKRNLHVLVCATGSVASVKIPLIVAELQKYASVDVHVVASKSALHFFDKDAIVPPAQVWTDEEEWSTWKSLSDPVLHIELRRWADLILVAPCSANTLAKMAGGFCDNITTSVLRALPQFVPVYVFPAMNTFMYTHPFTAKHLSVITSELGYKVYGPVSKTLACGDTGTGAMYEWSDIVKLVVEEYDLRVKS